MHEEEWGLTNKSKQQKADYSNEDDSLLNLLKPSSTMTGRIETWSAFTLHRFKLYTS